MPFNSETTSARIDSVWSSKREIEGARCNAHTAREGRKIVTSSSAAVILLDVGRDRMLAVLGCTGVFWPVFDPVEGCCGIWIDSALLDFAPVDAISSRSSLSPPPSARETRMYGGYSFSVISYTRKRTLIYYLIPRPSIAPSPDLHSVSSSDLFVVVREPEIYRAYHRSLHCCYLYAVKSHTVSE